MTLKETKIKSNPPLHCAISLRRLSTDLVYVKLRAGFALLKSASPSRIDYKGQGLRFEHGFL